MVRGTTPRLTFKFPFPVADVAAGYITIQQAGKTALELDFSGCELGEDTVSAHLTQAQTLALDPAHPCKIQVRVRTKMGEAMASQIITAQVERILRDGEI